MSTRLRVASRLLVVLFSLLSLPIAIIAQTGKVQTGPQPIVGASIYVFSSGTSGMGMPATSLLQGAGVTVDSSGNGYITSDNLGAFSLVGSFSCPAPDAQVYLVASGGNPGSGGVNPSSVLTAAIGDCSTLSSSTATINELTTVAAAWSLAPFAGAKSNQMSTAPTNIAGLKNAFITANHLVSSNTGVASTAAADGVTSLPTAELNTLGNILASCINSTGGTACSGLFTKTTPTGGTAPTDTFRAALNIAGSPGKNVADLYALTSTVPATQLFQPALTVAPHDWTVAIAFTAGGISAPGSLAVDATGDVWIVNGSGNSISELDNFGVAQFSSGLALPGASSLRGIAIDQLGSVWIANCGDGCANQQATLLKLDSTGALHSPAAGFALAGASSANSVAVDLNNNVWVSSDTDNLLVGVDGSGVALSGPAGFSTTTLNAPFSLSFDSLGNIWLPNRLGASISKVSVTGTEFAGSPYTGASLNSPAAVAVDAGNNVWIANSGSNVVSEFRNSGQLATTSTYTGAGVRTPQAIAIDGSGSVWIANGNSTISAISGTGASLSSVSGYKPSSFDALTSIAIDGSGNVWVTSCGKLCGGAGSGSVVELIGAGSPTVTPIALSVKTNPTPTNATARCNDWTYSDSATRSGTCSSHGGVMEWLTL